MSIVSKLTSEDLLWSSVTHKMFQDDFLIEQVLELLGNNKLTVLSFREPKKG